MNVYIVILQKVVSSQTILDPYEEIKQVLHKTMNVTYKLKLPNIWENYYLNEKKYDKNSQLYWIYNYIYNLYCNIIYQQELFEYLLIDNLIIINSVENKMKTYLSILDNMFISKETKNNFMINVAKAQRTYRGFSKLAYLYKYKKAKLQVTTNLMFDEIEPNHHNTIEIYHEGSRYLFTKNDLLNSINNSLLHSPYHFSEPLLIKNPYNNLKFSKSILYTIYFRIIENALKFPVLFHNFVWLNFDLKLFKTENEALIREHYFREYIYNTTDNIMISEMNSMLSLYFPCLSWKENDFPRKQIKQILRPYYYLYLVANYHISGLEKCEIARSYLIYKLKELYIYNPNFGRKILNKIKNSNSKFERRYNIDAPKFTMNEAYNYHLYYKNITFEDDEVREAERDNSDSEY